LSSVRCRDLLDWYHTHARRLPWRETTDPYRIWISEIMLQQTQVKTVLPRYTAWFDSFPDILALANAAEEQVMKAWEGLGYYRRARLLHTAAKQVSERHCGIFPENFEDIAALPGIGRSTAGAIASFCFGVATPVLDGNVKRVLKRWHGQADAGDKLLWELAQQAMNASGDLITWNQAMMELGATHCSPRNANCSACPVQQDCASAGKVDDTVTAKHSKVRDLHWRVNLHTDPVQGIWLTQRPATGIWAGLWTPPICELDTAPDEAPTHIHLLTHRRLHLYAAKANYQPAMQGQWFTEMDSVALPTGIKRMMQKQGISC